MTHLVQAEIEHGGLCLMPLDGIMRQLQHLSISAWCTDLSYNQYHELCEEASIAWLAQIN